MKYLDINTFLFFNSLLDSLDSGDAIINGRVEAYSCKNAGSDKKLYKGIEQQYSELSKSPKPAGEGDTMALSVSPFGPLAASASRKTFVYLIATLNASYCDYDFSNARPEQFRKEPNRHMIMNSINTTLAAVVPCYNAEVKDRLWNAVDVEVDLSKTDIYSYIPDLTSDPFTEDGVIWSFNYFFYNKALKRIIFFKCRSESKSSLSTSSGLAGSKHLLEGDEEEDISDDDQDQLWEISVQPTMNLGDMEFDTTSILI